MGGENNGGGGAILALYVNERCGPINVIAFIVTIIVQILGNLFWMYPLVVFIMMMIGMNLWYHIMVNAIVLVVLIMIYSYMFLLAILFKILHPMLIRYKKRCPFTLMEADERCPMCGCYLNSNALFSSRIGAVSSSSSSTHGNVTVVTTMSTAFTESYRGCSPCVVVKSFFHSIFGVFHLFTCWFKKLPKCGFTAILCSITTFWGPCIGFIIFVIVFFATSSTSLDQWYRWVGLVVGIVMLIEVFFLARVCENVQPMFYYASAHVCFPILCILSLTKGVDIPELKLPVKSDVVLEPEYENSNDNNNDINGGEPQIQHDSTNPPKGPEVKIDGFEPKGDAGNMGNASTMPDFSADFQNLSNNMGNIQNPNINSNNVPQMQQQPQMQNNFGMPQNIPMQNQPNFTSSVPSFEQPPILEDNAINYNNANMSNMNMGNIGQSGNIGE